ncbi:hypothetical protein, partial [Anaerostipes hadrus]|uniref:hypothetical protein n=1 Tax=Anaerostipes hadrus TaxID=649756 RepID=UPI001EDD8C1B
SYDPYRVLLTRVKGSWGGTAVTQFDYAYNTVGQRRFMGISGSAYSDYGGLSLYRAYRYNDRGELTRTATYH